jgi:hypothetical protein
MTFEEWLKENPTKDRIHQLLLSQEMRQYLRQKFKTGYCPEVLDLYLSLDGFKVIKGRLNRNFWIGVIKNNPDIAQWDRNWTVKEIPNDCKLFLNGDEVNYCGNDKGTTDAKTTGRKSKTF